MTAARARSGAVAPRVALIAEATYPHFMGGVSVWCDHLLRGLPDVGFDLYAICDDAMREPVWETPQNVRSLSLIPIGAGVRRLWRPYSRAQRAEFVDRFEALCRALFGNPSLGSADFLDALKGLRDVSKVVPIQSGLRFDESIGVLSALWARESFDQRSSSSRGAHPTLADVVSALGVLGSLLRPLEARVAPCDLVHSTANGLAMLTAFATKWEHNVPLILTEHGVYLRERYLAAAPEDESRAVATLRMRFFRHLNGAGFLMADRLTPVSQFNGRWEENTGAPREKIQIIHNGVDPVLFPEVVPPVGPPTISWIGRIDPLKDLETLVEAFALVVGQIPAARLRLFGPVPAGNEKYHRRIVDLVEHLELSGRVTFEGHAPDPAVAYRAGHVVALSSISEGLPYTLIEAMMSGCATVSTDVGGVAEVAGRAGMLVPARDPEAFARACVDLLSNPLKRTKLAMAARKRALSLFTIEQFVHAYSTLYSDVVASGIEGLSGAPDPWQQSSIGRTRRNVG